MKQLTQNYYARLTVNLLADTWLPFLITTIILAAGLYKVIGNDLERQWALGLAEVCSLTTVWATLTWFITVDKWTRPLWLGLIVLCLGETAFFLGLSIVLGSAEIFSVTATELEQSAGQLQVIGLTTMLVSFCILGQFFRLCRTYINGRLT